MESMTDSLKRVYTTKQKYVLRRVFFIIMMAGCGVVCGEGRRCWGSRECRVCLCLLLSVGACLYELESRASCLVACDATTGEVRAPTQVVEI